jgi:hypothetical protein
LYRYNKFKAALAPWEFQGAIKGKITIGGLSVDASIMIDTETGVLVFALEFVIKTKILHGSLSIAAAVDYKVGLYK